MYAGLSSMSTASRPSSSAATATVPLPAKESSQYEFGVEAPRELVFDHLLRVGQDLNLNVQVLEKSSGLVRFENATLSSEQLDRYCLYPFVHATNSQQPYDTFWNWNARSLQGGGGPVTGRVSLTVLLTQDSAKSTAVNIRGNWGGGNTHEQYLLNSKAVLEKEVEQKLKARLATPATAPGRE